MPPPTKPDLFRRRPANSGRGASLSRVLVRSLPGQRSRGTVLAGSAVIPCALGPAGIVHGKREGDGGTPAGSFRVLRLLIRPDRTTRPRTTISSKPMRTDDGWCDDPASCLYNRPVRRPFPSSHESLWREDGLYDCIGVMDYNFPRVRKRRGSAIFLHVAAPGFSPTAGCIAVRRTDLIRLLGRISPVTKLVIR